MSFLIFVSIFLSGTYECRMTVKKIKWIFSCHCIGFFSLGKIHDTLITSVFILGLDYLHFFRMQDTKLFDDWCIESLIQNCPSIKALDIRGCTSVTSNGLEMLHKLRFVLIISLFQFKLSRPRYLCSRLLFVLADYFCFVPTLSFIGYLLKMHGSRTLHINEGSM